MLSPGFSLSLPAGAAAALRDQGYRVETRLGEGASGEVWRAIHTASGREVAVKILKSPAGGGAPDPSGHRWEWRFQREVEAASILDHPNICRMLDSGFLPEGGQAWMAMELVDGPPLTTYAEEEKMNATRRVELFQKVCAGVAHAHHRGILHRDLKPANIPVHHDGTPKVLDFGLARFLNSETAPGPAVSRAGVLLGTPAYMAPEQIDGPAEPDTRSDIYSLGVVLYELLTGILPHEAPPGTAALLAAIVRGQPRPPRGVHPDLAAILMKALRKDPSERYHSADSLSDDLGRHLRGEPVRARQGQMWYAARRHLRKHRKAAAGWSLLAAGFAGLAGYTAWQRNAGLERRARMLEEARDAMEEMLVDAGTEARAAGRPELANRMAERMAAIPWNWAEEHGGGFDLRRHKSVSARLRADMEASELRYQKALPLYFEASSAAAGLAADFPDIPRFQMDAALARMGLGLCLTEMEKSREAGDCLRHAVGLLQKLPRDMAGRELAKALRALGRLETMAKRPEAAAQAFTEALRALEGSGDGSAAGERELIRLDHARVTPGQGGPAEADAALAALLAAAELPGAAVTDQVRLSEGLIAHAAAMQACGAWKKAAASLSEARLKHRTLLDAGLATQRFKTGMTLGKMLRQCAEGMTGAGDTQDALETLGAALEHMRDFRSPGSPYDAEVRTELARILRSRAAAEERSGLAAEAATNFSKAASRLAECAKLQRGRPGTHLDAAEAGLNAWRLRDAAGLSPEAAGALLKHAGEQIRAAESKGSSAAADRERSAELNRKLEAARAGAR